MAFASKENTPDSGLSIKERLIQTAPFLLLALMFAYPKLSDGNYLPLADHLQLALILQSEFLALVSGFFLIFPLVMTAMKTRGFTIFAIIYALLVWGFTQYAWSINGLEGVLSYLLLLFFTYGGIALVTRKSFIRQTLLMMVSLRWVCYLFLFPPLVAIFGLGEANITRWRTSQEILWIGSIFFTSAGILELFLFAPLGAYISSKIDKLDFHLEMDDDELPPHILRRKKFFNAIKKPQS